MISEGRNFMPIASWLVEVDRLVHGRCHMARLQRFVEDSTKREMVVPTPPLTAKQVASGHCSSGIFTVVEPPDLDLYRSYIPDPLRHRTGAIHELGQFEPRAGKRGQVQIHSFGRRTQIQTAEWEPGTV